MPKPRTQSKSVMLPGGSGLTVGRFLGRNLKKQREYTGISCNYLKQGPIQTERI